MLKFIYPISIPTPPVNAQESIIDLNNNREIILMTLALVIKLNEKIDSLSSKIL